MHPILLTAALASAITLVGKLILKPRSKENDERKKSANLSAASGDSGSDPKPTRTGVGESSQVTSTHSKENDEHKKTDD